VRTTRIEGVLTAQSPVHHGGDEKTGSEVLMRRMKYIVGGEAIEVPVVSGNAIRGPLRRHVMRDLCESVGHTPTVKMYHLLFSGGILEEVAGKKSGTIDLELREAIRNTLPPLSLLGASILNQITAGKLQVGIATPACQELNEFHPALLQSATSFYELLDDSFQTRKDDLKSPLAGEAKVQMMFTFETLAPGTRFRHALTLLDHTDLEASCLQHMISLWQADPHIGGHSATGFGQVRIAYDWSADFPGPDLYRRYLQQEGENVLGVLQDLEERLG
jgi:hypothetical protein